VGGRTTNLTKTPFLILFVILISVSIGTASMSNAQLGTVPDWFKGVAGFWAEGKITTTEFLDGITFLIEQEVIQVPGYVQAAEAQSINQTSIDELWIAIADLQNQEGDSDSQNASIDAEAEAANAEIIAALEVRVAELEILLVSMTADSGNVYFSGVNLHIRDGSGTTECVRCNGLGNLIVGYDELRPAGNDKSGSNNLVVGKRNNYSSYGGFVAGHFNTISGAESSVSGGSQNHASGNYASVSGGSTNHASGHYSSVSGGGTNEASGQYSSVSGGGSNQASGITSSISGGKNNQASGALDWGAGDSAGHSTYWKEFSINQDLSYLSPFIRVTCDEGDIAIGSAYTNDQDYTLKQSHPQYYNEDLGGYEAWDFTFVPDDYYNPAGGDLWGAVLCLNIPEIPEELIIIPPNLLP